MLTREELLEIGVNPDNMTYPMGEMNVIVQCFGYEDACEAGIRYCLENLI